jgi:HEAT repeat protein
MDIKDLIDDLCLFDGRYKRAQVEEALARQEEIVPHLIALLEAVLANPQRYAEDEDFFGHLYAALLLGHFREKRAHQTLVNLFSLPDAQVSRLFEDTITEDLPGLLLNTCGGGFEAIKSLVENRGAYEYCRSSALRAMAYAVVTGQMERETAIAYFREVLKNPSDEPPSNVFEEAACGLLHLYPEESMDLIEQAYDDNLIHPGYVSPGDFARQLAIGREAALEELADQWDMRNPADFHRRMEWWACFKQEESTPFHASRGATEKKVHQKKKAKRKMARASKRKGRKRKKK